MKNIDKNAFLGPLASYRTALELFTANCNLRCVYCSIQTDQTVMPDYPRHQMSSEVINHFKLLIDDDKPLSIDLCGNGETTLLEDWLAVCEPFISFDHVKIITNFAKILSWEEASFLARFDYISTSIDTADLELLKEIRYPVDLRTIIYNINLVKTAAIVQGLTLPLIDVNCTVTTKTYQDPARLVALAAAVGIRQVTFSGVFETATAVKHGVRSIETLGSDALADAAVAFKKAKETAASSGVKIVVNSSQLSALLEGGSVKDDNSSYDRSTVMCLQPWSGFWVNSDGRASFCCRHMATTDNAVTSYSSVRDILNDVNAVHLRNELLAGRCPGRCRTCELAQSTDIASLRLAVQALNPAPSRIVMIAKKIPFAQTIWRYFMRRASSK